MVPDEKVHLMMDKGNFVLVITLYSTWDCECTLNYPHVFMLQHQFLCFEKSHPVELIVKHPPELVNVWDTLLKHLLYRAYIPNSGVFSVSFWSARPHPSCSLSCLGSFEGLWMKHACIPLCLSSVLFYLGDILLGLSKSISSCFLCPQRRRSTCHLPIWGIPICC